MFILGLILGSFGTVLILFLISALIVGSDK